MTMEELRAILGSEMIRSTEHPSIVELRPSFWFGRRDDTKLERMINTFISAHDNVFFHPHEEWGTGAKYQAWELVEPGSWLVPATATADDVLNDPGDPVGWTLYTALKPVDQSDWSELSLETLVAARRVTAIVVSDPDGSPQFVGLASVESGSKY
jgi:hypothetical protein